MKSTDATTPETWARYRETGSIELRNEIAMANIGLVTWVLGRYLSGRETVIYKGDGSLKQEGFIGLLHAVERYDPSRGVKFSPFACRSIWGTMMDRVNPERMLSVQADELPLDGASVPDDRTDSIEPNETWDDLAFGLGPSDAKALEDRFKRDMTLREIAARDGVTFQAADLRIRRAVRHARQIWETRRERELCTRTA